MRNSNVTKLVLFFSGMSTGNVSKIERKEVKSQLWATLSVIVIYEALYPIVLSLIVPLLSSGNSNPIAPFQSK